MKIAFVITELLPGGAERCLVELACFLKKSGHEVRVWQLWPEPPETKRHLTERLVDAGVSVRHGNASRAHQFPGTVIRLAKELRQFAPDVVQSFLFHGNFASALARPKSSRFFGGARVRQPERLRQWLQRLAAKRMEKLICVSDSVRQHCEESEGIPAEQLAVIPNGIDIDHLTQQASQPVDDKDVLNKHCRTLLFVGRLTEQKGVLPFAEQIDPLLNQLPEHQIVLIGEGDQKEQLVKRIQSCEHRDRVYVLGWKPAVAPWMLRAELIFLPASYEGMPNVILEAMGLGKPFVSFEVDGIHQLLGPHADSSPQVAKTGDFADFAQRIIQIANDADRRMKLGRENQARIQEEFALENQLPKYLELYSSVARS